MLSEVSQWPEFRLAAGISGARCSLGCAVGQNLAGDGPDSPKPAAILLTLRRYLGIVRRFHKSRATRVLNAETLQSGLHAGQLKPHSSGRQLGNRLGKGETSLPYQS
jgi:hypothetical protein